MVAGAGTARGQCSQGPPAAPLSLPWQDLSMWALPWAGLGLLRAWQLQIPYMQLKALRESQVEAVSLLLTPPW